MKLALISLSKDDPEGGGPIGLLPLFDNLLVDRQVRVAGRLGAEKIIFLCPTIPGAILQYIDELKVRKIDAEIVRTARELVQYSSEENELIVVADGVLPSSKVESLLAEQIGEVIYTVENDEVFEDFERIDLNQRWLGLAKLKASRLSMMIDVPDDWNVGSALLRIAVQSECERIVIPGPDIIAGSVVHLENSSETTEYTRRKLKEPGLAKGGLLERFLIWPVSRRLLPRLWQTSNSRIYLRIGSLFSSAAAVITAYFQYTFASLALLLVAGIFSAVNRDMDALSDVKFRLFSDYPERPHLLDLASIALSLLSMTILVKNASQTSDIIANITVLILLWIGISVREILPDPKKYSLLKPGGILSILILMILAPFGLFLFGIYGLAVWTALYALLSASSLASQVKKGAISE